LPFSGVLRILNPGKPLSITYAFEIKVLLFNKDPEVIANKNAESPPPSRRSDLPWTEYLFGQLAF